MTQNILIIEDEEKIARVISLELEYEGYQSDIAASGKEGLDVMLPELNGMEVLRRIRSTDTYTPVILITARDSVVDKVNGLDQGANDYITKPFQIEELLARIRACLRTNAIYQKEEEEQLQAGDLTVNEKTRDVIRRGEAIELTPREFDLLVYLLRNKQQVLNREQILTNVWGFDYYGDTNVVDVYVRYLRRKVDYPFDTPLIHTVRGVGYTLKEQA
jgi:DNA-binding response OmpR family regulator